MPEKKISVEVKPLIKKLGKGYELNVVAMKPKGGNISWIAIIKDKDGESVAAFAKPLERSKYLVSIGIIKGNFEGTTFPINDNGVQATYQDWKAATEKLLEVKIPWRPTGRAMFRLNI